MRIVAKDLSVCRKRVTQQQHISKDNIKCCIHAWASMEVKGIHKCPVIRANIGDLWEGGTLEVQAIMEPIGELNHHT